MHPTIGQRIYFSGVFIAVGLGFLALVTALDRFWPGFLVVLALASSAIAWREQQWHKLVNHYKEMASIDPVTGVFTRRFILEEIEREFALHLRLARFKERASDSAVVVIDLNNFKEINDQHGHAVGDAALAAVAADLKRAIRKTDVMGRLGGDEFAIVLRLISDTGMFASRVRDLLCPKTVLHQDKPIHIGLSLGWARLHEGKSVAEILDLADSRMYEMKRAD